MQHTVRSHRFDPYFVVHCKFDGCGVSYNNWASFKSHVKRKHKANRLMDEAQDEVNNEVNVDDGGLPAAENHDDDNINVGFQGKHAVAKLYVRFKVH